MILRLRACPKSLPQVRYALEMRASYPSDISREQFEHIRPLLESARKSARPRRVDLYEVFCAMLYLLRTVPPTSRSGPRSMRKASAC